MFFLDVSPEESLKRINSRNEYIEMFENLNSLRKARKKSKKVTYNLNVISGDDSIESISQKNKRKMFRVIKLLLFHYL